MNPCQDTTREFDWLEMEERIERARNSDEIKFWRGQQAIITKQSKDKGLEDLRKQLISAHKKGDARKIVAMQEHQDLIDIIKEEPEGSSRLESLHKAAAKIEKRIERIESNNKAKIEAIEAVIRTYCKQKKL